MKMRECTNIADDTKIKEDIKVEESTNGKEKNMEFTELRPVLEKAALGAYLNIPLKYETSKLNESWLQQTAVQKDITTMDINESIKEMFNRNNHVNVGFCYEIPVEKLQAELLGETEESVSQFVVVNPKDGVQNRFWFHSAYLYIFHTQVAFLSLGIRFPNMDTLIQICNPGFADNPAEYYYLDKEERMQAFSMSDAVRKFCGKAGIDLFFDNGNNIFLENFTYTVAVVEKRFRNLETMRKITFNEHRMVQLTESVEDDSEDDVRYVYGVKNQQSQTYRWGCCISSQTISYVVADETLDIDSEMSVQAEDGLPIVMLALYEKYTCLHFTELLAVVDEKKIKRLKQLKKLMLEFQAYGTVHPANLSRWHNVKSIYMHLLETNGITDAIEDVGKKVTILNEHQKDVERTKNDTVISLITIFGAVSILASMLSIIQILAGGDSLEWMVTILTVAVVVMIPIGVSLWGEREE